LLMEGNMTASQKASQKAAIKLIHSCGKPRWSENLPADFQKSLPSVYWTWEQLSTPLISKYCFVALEHQKVSAKLHQNDWLCSSSGRHIQQSLKVSYHNQCLSRPPILSRTSVIVLLVGRSSTGRLVYDDATVTWITWLWLVSKYRTVRPRVSLCGEARRSGSIGTRVVLRCVFGM
jgi:hypothetical protein